MKRNLNRYLFKWLHKEVRNEEEVERMHDYIDRFSRSMILRDTLHRSNFNIIEFLRNQEKITVTDETTKKNIIPYPLRFLNERGRFNYMWEKFKVIFNDELDDDERVVEKYNSGKGVIYERVVLVPRKWENFDDRRKIMHTMLLIFYKKIIQRIQALWN
jgi:hypothetical protein